MHTAIETPFDIFRKVTDRAASAITNKEIRYRFSSKEEAVKFEADAAEIILVNHLQLIANTEERSNRGVVREIAVVVAPVPEDYYEDEAPDEGMPSYWDAARGNDY